MNKLWQIFVAPGEGTQPLKIKASPWHEERYVRIPRSHWDLLIEFAKSIHLDSGERLDFYSFATESDDENDFVQYNDLELEKVLEFIASLKTILQKSEPIHISPTADIPDTYENFEYVRMLEAVAEVFEEALRFQQPFRAWIE